MRDSILILKLAFTSKGVVDVKYLNCAKNLLSDHRERIFCTIKLFNIDQLFGGKSLVKNKYTIPQKDLKITITYEKLI